MGTITTVPFATFSYFFAVADTKAYLMGGSTVMAGNQNSFVQIYDFMTNTWTEGTPLPHASLGGSAVAVSEKIYCFDGYRTQIYNTVTNTWTIGTTMPFPLVSTSGVLAGNRIYIIGGNVNGNESNLVQIYDPASDSWTEGPSLNAGRICRCILVGNKIYSFGGYYRNTDVVEILELHDLPPIVDPLPDEKVKGCVNVEIKITGCSNNAMLKKIGQIIYESDCECNCDCCCVE